MSASWTSEREREILKVWDEKESGSGRERKRSSQVGQSVGVPLLAVDEKERIDQDSLEICSGLRDSPPSGLDTF